MMHFALCILNEKCKVDYICVKNTEYWMISTESGLQQSLYHFQYAGSYCLWVSDNYVKIHALSQLKCQ